MDEAGRPAATGARLPAAETGFSAAEMGVLAHLYRGELYRSTVWRTRLDTTTNWAVVSTGLALSLTFADPSASPLPLMLVGLLVGVFLFIEARRYRFFDFWRIRAHILEVYFFGPILRGERGRRDREWSRILYRDYRNPVLHITMAEALGRRLRHNYAWIFLIQVTAYLGKLIIHPVPITTLDEFWARAAIGPISGMAVLLCGCLFHGTWLLIAIVTANSRRGADRPHEERPERDLVLELARSGPPE
ncbi:DUF2270 domain-containing protein [Arenibaculum pallidiluteum]|uniref:DUF2270 domain-containing protein n=1 Tax=Arenibaculum pallidiluteum TaxID=2812559 RepID=UPI001A975054|nr:DUF2270 domain-containing protein [Arenibaculum pallidiluteum]